MNIKIPFLEIKISNLYILPNKEALAEFYIKNMSKAQNDNSLPEISIKCQLPFLLLFSPPTAHVRISPLGC